MLLLKSPRFDQKLPAVLVHRYRARASSGSVKWCTASAMSIRTLNDAVEHVTIRGTSVSTSFAFPSVLHVSIVHKFGLPNRHGIIQCDNFVVYLRFDAKNDALVYVWASRVDDNDNGDASWTCCIT